MCNLLQNITPSSIWAYRADSITALPHHPRVRYTGRTSNCYARSQGFAISVFYKLLDTGNTVRLLFSVK